MGRYYNRWRHRNKYRAPHFSKWEQRKYHANKKSFSMIRLVIGDALTDILLAGFKLSIIVGIISFLLSTFLSPAFSKIASFSFRVFLVCFALMGIIFVIGLIVNPVGNAANSIAKMFRRR